MVYAPYTTHTPEWGGGNSGLMKSSYNDNLKIGSFGTSTREARPLHNLTRRAQKVMLRIMRANGAERFESGKV